MKKRSSSFIIFLALTIACWAANSDNEIRYILNSDGLSNSSINSIFQDSKGMLWLGTWDGLNSYNGDGFDVYRPISGSENSISHHVIRNIEEDCEDNLWISTDNGINKFNRHTKLFDRYFTNYSNQLILNENTFSIAIKSNGEVWVSVFRLGLFKYNKTTNDFEKIEIQGIKTNLINKVIFDKNDNLWALENGLQLIKLSFANNSVNTKSIKIKTNNILYDKERKIWGQNSSNLLFNIDTQNDDLTINTIVNKHGGELHSVICNNETYYLATSHGLILLDDKLKEESIEYSGISVFSVFIDSDNTLWVGTDSKGVIMSYAKPKPFYSFGKKELAQIGDYSVRAITKDNDSTYWIGTKGSGLLRAQYSKANNSTKSLAGFTVKNGLTHNSVLSLFTSSNGTVWVGGDGEGLQYIRKSSNEIKTLSGVKNSNIKSIYSIISLNDTVLWVGTSGYGLFKINVQKVNGHYEASSVKQYKNSQLTLSKGINNNIIYSLAIQNDSLLWIGTRGGGLNCLNLKTDKFNFYKNSTTDSKSISSNDVVSICLDYNNNLWLGTGSGLNKFTYNAENGSFFTRYDEINGIPNSCIHTVNADSENNIWATTNKGIFRLNTSNNTINCYDYRDGLQNNEFSDGASYYDEQYSKMLVGGIDGITIFNPSKIKSNIKFPPLLLDGLEINNISFPIHNNNKSYSFKHKSQYIKFKFTIFDYISNQKCKLSYRLTGGGPSKVSSNKWVEANSRNIILSNLSAGSYKLQVKHSNSDNIWSDDILIINFEVEPPFWLSIWAFMLYIIVCIAITVFIFKNKQNKIKLTHTIELETLNKNRAEEIHQAKLRFFTNIAHEFSNSITLIYGPCEKILMDSEVTEQVRSYLYIIKRNAERMNELIKQLMEFRKADTGHLKMNYEYVDIKELIRYTSDNFKAKISEKNISFDSEIGDDIKDWVTDRDSVEKIVFNLLSNACKYTPNNGTISIKAYKEEKNLIIKCINSGKGISNDDLGHIFNRFHILENAEGEKISRTGVGLALSKSLAQLLKGQLTVNSKLNDKTTFSLILPECDVVVNKNEDEKELNFTHQFENISLNNKNKLLTYKEKKVLIVDDNYEIRFLLKEILNVYFEVIEADNGELGFELAKSMRPDLILSDVIMPKVNGIELANLLKNEETTSFIPIVLLSSRVSVESHIEGLQKGAIYYINKPFNPEHLLAVAATLLENTQKTKEFLTSPLSNKKMYNEKEIDSEDYQFINRVLEVLKTNINNEDYNQDSLAEVLCISKVQLYRKIKKITNRTPSDFIRRYRLQEVESMLKTTSKTIQEIMYDCGFNNKAYFYREFQKVYGCTPKDFRVSFQNNKTT